MMDIEVKYHGKTVGHTDINADKIEFKEDESIRELLHGLFNGKNTKMAILGLTTGTVDKYGTVDKHDTDMNNVVGILRI